MNKKDTFSMTRARARLGVVMLATTAMTLCGAAASAQMAPPAGGAAARPAAMTPAQQRQMQMRKMQAAMAAKRRNAIPATMPIYDPMGGHAGRNVKRGDAETCLQWRGGPKGTLVPMGMTPPPVPMPGTHGLFVAGQQFLRARYALFRGPGQL